MDMWQAKKHSKIKLDYQRRRQHNPFFRREKKQRQRRVWLLWLLLISTFVIFTIWFFLYSPVWKIKKIEINGLSRTDQGKIEEMVREEQAKKRYLIFSQTNIILFDSRVATNRIMEEYNLIDLKITKKLPGTLELKASERPYAFIFQEGSAYFYASADAYIISEPAVTDSDRAKYFILENKNNSLIGEKNKINLTKEYLQFILDLSGQLAISNLAVERYIIDQELNTLKVKFASGPLAFFNIRDVAASQVERLLLLLAKKPKMKDNFSKINYIDLRYGDRIFVNPETLIN